MASRTAPSAACACSAVSCGARACTAPASAPSASGSVVSPHGLQDGAERRLRLLGGELRGQGLDRLRQRPQRIGVGGPPHGLQDGAERRLRLLGGELRARAWTARASARSASGSVVPRMASRTAPSAACACSAVTLKPNARSTGSGRLANRSTSGGFSVNCFRKAARVSGGSVARSQRAPTSCGCKLSSVLNSSRLQIRFARASARAAASAVARCSARVVCCSAWFCCCRATLAATIASTAATSTARLPR